MNALHIDTSDNKNIVVRIVKGDKNFELKSIANKDKAQAALPLIEKLLKDAKLKASQIEEINVNPGPGSFTGLRVGVAIANALSFGLQVKINGKKAGELVTPTY